MGKLTDMVEGNNRQELHKKEVSKDQLTRLYNKKAIEGIVNEYIATSTENTRCVLIKIEINSVEEINKRLGTIFGDAVLIEWSTNLQKILPENSFAGRISYNQFVVFVYRIRVESEIFALAQKICAQFQTISIGSENAYQVWGNLGISFYPKDAASFLSLEKFSDIAMEYARTIGKNRYFIYQETIDNTNKVEIREEENQETNWNYSDAAAITISISNLMFHSQDTQDTIRMILALMGNYFNVDYISVQEYSLDLKSMSSTYEWKSREEIKGYVMDNVIIEDVYDNVYFIKSDKELYYAANYEELSHNLTSEESYKAFEGVKTICQCRIAEKSEERGYINFVNYDTEKNWTVQERNILLLVHKMLGAYLINIKIKEAATNLRYIDQLTGLYHVEKFYETVSQILLSSDNKYAVIYTDIDKFKLINSTFGYAEGDKILVVMAETLRECSRPGEAFARISGDQFTALWEYTSDDEIAERIKDFNRLLMKKVSMYDRFIKLSLITGIYVTSDIQSASVCVDRANIARKSIKKRHKSNYAFFDEQMKSELVKRREIENVMEEALENGEFEVYYQPKCNLLTEEICAAEALVRWNRNGEIKYPDEFIPIFEDNGFIVDIDYYVMETVCKMLRMRLDAGDKVVPIAVNFSRVHFDSTKIVNELKCIADSYNISTNLIEVEITESACNQEDEFFITVFYKLKEQGFKLSMDDFGAGLSSLNLLHRLPFDIIKIDKDFFQKGSATKTERIVIKNIVNMARELEMEIVSEGVETREQADFLKTIGCYIVQGYLFGKAEPYEVFQELYL